jgi:hypothetical protein
MVRTGNPVKATSINKNDPPHKMERIAKVAQFFAVIPASTRLKGLAEATG